MKKLMILGASDLQLPAILKCKELGISSCVLDFNDKAIGKEYADIFYCVSILDHEGILKVAEMENVDGIMTLASDRPIPIIADIASKLNLKSVTTKAALNATNKAYMRKVLSENGVPIPKFFIVKCKEEYKIASTFFGNNYITKPADNSGSRGIFLVSKENDIELAYEYSMKNSTNHCILVEEYMVGPEVSVETFAINGIVNIVAITDKITTGAPYFVEIGHTQPSQLSDEVQFSIRKIAKEAVKALGISNGPSHVEIKITEDGPKIVEVGARLGGDCITTHLTPLSTGIDLVKLSIENSLSMPVMIGCSDNKAAIIRYFKNKTGILTKIDSSQVNDENVVEIVFTKQVGDLIGEVRCSNDRLGYIITRGNSIQEAEMTYEKALEKIVIDIEEV